VGLFFSLPRACSKDPPEPDMFGFNSKKAEVLSHWYTPVPNFSLSTREFYAAIEREVSEQRVPGLQMSRQEFSEGGPLSAQREYLRMIRERLVFDICAAPFGTNYFFSCRFAEMPAVVSIWQLMVLALGALIACYVSFVIAAKLFGVYAAVFWPIGCITALLLVIYTLRNAVAMGLKDLDAALIRTPVIGSVYEAWFRRDSYYRQDTRLMYLTVVEGVVKKLVEEETSAKGIRLLTQYEYAPVFGELYKASRLGRTEEKAQGGRLNNVAT
jgi:hypothetical protein